MGYCISVLKTEFLLKNENKPAALAAIKALRGQETCKDSSGAHFSWVDNDKFDKASTLEEMLDEWRWIPKIDDQGNIIDLEFTGEKYGDDNLLFRAIAPFVEHARIAFLGEDGARWLFEIEDGEFKELMGHDYPL